jgi:hypothetical protein
MSSRNAVCTGKFVYVSSRDCEGIIDCAAHQFAPFRFASTWSRGTGTGKIDDKKFRLYAWLLIISQSSV